MKDVRKQPNGDYSRVNLTSYHILAEDKKTIIYRPMLKRLTDCIHSALLLSQIIFWWNEHKEQPFYKFSMPCEHPKYRQGDSWNEELAFTRTELETALKYIATKVKGGNDKSALQKVHQEDGQLAPVNHLVLYWRDRDNVTWYELNHELLIQHLEKVYNSKTANAESLHSLGNVENGHSANAESLHHLLSENTTENTREKDYPATPDISEKPLDTPEKQTKPRARNEVFDAIAWYFFGVKQEDTAAIKGIAPLVNKLCTFLKSRPIPVNAERVLEFWYFISARKKDLSYLRYLTNFTPCWIEFEATPKRVLQPSDAPKHIELPRTDVMEGVWKKRGES